MKTCTLCNVAKPETAFYRDARSPDGLAWWCRDCRLARNKRNNKACYWAGGFRRRGRPRLPRPARPPGPAEAIGAEAIAAIEERRRLLATVKRLVRGETIPGEILDAVLPGTAAEGGD
jgi:hypothetical protein